MFFLDLMKNEMEFINLMESNLLKYLLLFGNFNKVICFFLFTVLPDTISVPLFLISFHAQNKVSGKYSQSSSGNDKYFALENFIPKFREIERPGFEVKILIEFDIPFGISNG